MPDKLNELYKKWLADAKPTEEFSLQCFQAGLSAGASSMRTRAMKVVQDRKNIPGMNEIINEIGKLSDIPD